MAERSYPVPKVRGSGQDELRPHWKFVFVCRRAKRSYSTFKIRRGGLEEITLIQGKEQRLCFAEAAMKRYTGSR